ncbi:hypothetical protein LR48_Vigan04g001700 [Vigna angularis]|uniref:non-specific serine/threonine protein kinase n=1 Tax=Phaseolus angularis TaxID=3914 RepID=A0A0L9UBA4_PHAAN|nr:hypothetical protein LR48_Vigan04g001700 [Vigna angularis]
MTLTMNKFLNEMEKEKVIMFTEQHLRIATDNYSYLKGSGGFGKVYRGIFSDGTIVAVKVLHAISEERIEEQFMAEVGTIGKIHHFNLVRLYGFSLEKNFTALVYEYMGNGSLDKFLFKPENALGFEKLYEIAIGTAKGISYLHEECQQRIIHYDIKPGNILLDRNFNAKVADFGLAKLCNRENTHITFGMLLFEILGRRRNFEIDLAESQEWFPMWIWKKVEAEEAEELMVACGINDQNKETAERMMKVALSCVQYKQESRPVMSVVVKMLEGSVVIPKPLNPFPHLVHEILPLPESGNTNTSSTVPGFSGMVTESSHEPSSLVVTKFETESAST